MPKKTYSPKKCECGCGKEFTPTREWQRFIDDAHRWKHWYQTRKEASRLDKARKILDRQDIPLEARLKKIKRLLGKRGAMTEAN